MNYYTLKGSVRASDSITHSLSVSKRGFWLIGSVSEAGVTKQRPKIRKIRATAEKVKWLKVVYMKESNKNMN